MVVADQAVDDGLLDAGQFPKGDLGLLELAVLHLLGDDLLDQVREGALHPGDKLPSERALCAIYAVSQITVRRALRELRHGGVLVSRHGLGWYVESGAHAGVAVPAVAVVLPEDYEFDWRYAPPTEAGTQPAPMRSLLTTTWPGVHAFRA